MPSVALNLLLAVALCLLLGGCDSKPTRSKAENDGRTATAPPVLEATGENVPVIQAEVFETLPAGRSYELEIDGTPIDGFPIYTSDRSSTEFCGVAIPTESGGYLEVPRTTASFEPDLVEVEVVKEIEQSRQYFRTLECDTSAMIPVRFGSTSSGPTHYRKRTSGNLRFTGPYRITKNGDLELLSRGDGSVLRVMARIPLRVAKPNRNP